MTAPRWDETWHRLRQWTVGQGPSERMAALLLAAEGYTAIDPSHPLGGPDGGKDAMCKKDGRNAVMAVYFPRGQQSFKALTKKFVDDLAGARANGGEVFAFVTNQEITLGQREQLAKVASPTTLDLYHLERVAMLLDVPGNAGLRRQFLGIDFADNDAAAGSELVLRVLEGQRRIEGLHTGGDSFAYFMLYHFDLQAAVAQQMVVIKQGEFSVFDLSLRVRDMDRSVDIFKRALGNLNQPAEMIGGRWPLPEQVYYRTFFHARNGSWNQDLILRRSQVASCWLAATRVLGRDGRSVAMVHHDRGYESQFGPAGWRE